MAPRGRQVDTTRVLVPRPTATYIAGHPTAERWSMAETARELLDVVVRWLHVIAGIMWIGNSMLFNWLDRNLVSHGQAGRSGPGAIGDIWLLHSGAFYFVEKTSLGGAGMPRPMHWFKWQAYTTWLSGAVLLAVVYYLGGRAALVNPGVQGLSTAAAIAIGVAVIVAGWAVYDALWSSPLGKQPPIAALVSMALLLAAAYGLSRLFNSRAAFLHIGALLGTIMAGNVAMRIMPAQRQLVAAAEQGQPPDAGLSGRAKMRSIHNNYITFPMLALMVSNHFPSLYGHRYNWLVLAVLFVAGAGVRHWLNVRFTEPQWRPALAATIVAGVAALWALSVWPSHDAGAVAAGSGPVSFADARHIIDQRCAACHSAQPSDRSFGVSPAGVAFDTPDQIRAYAERIRVRAVETGTMPIGNKTLMTPGERAVLGRWIAQGARIESPAP